MPRKKMTDEEKKAWGAKMKAAREAKKTAVTEAPQDVLAPEPEVEDKVVQETDIEALKRQMNEVMETNALLKAAILRGDVAPQGQPTVGAKGLVGEFEKYILDESQYPDPTKRLAQEPRLAPLAFNYNYVLKYEFSIRAYPTQQGIYTKEPEFTVTLWRKKIGDDGEVEKRVNPANGKLEEVHYRARRLMFHEDPEAALVIAHDNNIDVDKTDERAFLNEMRYLRVRDWLFDVFWPKPATKTRGMREEVIGNQLVEVVFVNSENAQDLTGDLAQLTKKL